MSGVRGVAAVGGGNRPGVGCGGHITGDRQPLAKPACGQILHKSLFQPGIDTSTRSAAPAMVRAITRLVMANTLCRIGRRTNGNATSWNITQTGQHVGHARQSRRQTADSLPSVRTHVGTYLNEDSVWSIRGPVPCRAGAGHGGRNGRGAGIPEHQEGTSPARDPGACAYTATSSPAAASPWPPAGCNRSRRRAAAGTRPSGSPSGSHSASGGFLPDNERVEAEPPH